MKFMTLKPLLLLLGIGTVVSILPSYRFAHIEKSKSTATPEIITYQANGKKMDAPLLSKTYTPSEWTQNSLNEVITDDLLNAIDANNKLFKYRSKKKNFSLDNLQISRKDLIQTSELLKFALNHPEVDPAEIFDLHQIKGRDDKGGVHFTGYYSPILKVSRKKTKAFPYPIYRKPKKFQGKLPSRGEIDSTNVLANQELEIAYAANLVDIYFMQVQGSGFIEYADGSKSLLSYGGNNKRRYKSIGRYMINQGYTTPDKVSINSIKKYLWRNPDKLLEVLSANPSYVFFNEGKGVVKGAGVTPLTEGHSIAVDPKYIPLGSTLLAKVPIADNQGNFIKHEYRILFAQDTGGAINGPGHVDLFTGVGKSAKRIACNTHHYGELWLITPKYPEARP